MSREIFKDFKIEVPQKFYDGNGTIRLTYDAGYVFDEGWSKADAQAFDREALPAIAETLKKYKWKIEIAPEGSGKAPIFSKFYRDGYLYVHPEGITGYCKEDEAKEILTALEKCKCIRNPQLSFKELPEMTDAEYSDLIINHSQEIAELLTTAMSNNIHPKEVGFDFASNSRPEYINTTHRAYPGLGISSLDVDVKLVNDIYAVLKKINYFELVSQVEQNTEYEID